MNDPWSISVAPAVSDQSPAPRAVFAATSNWPASSELSVRPLLAAEVVLLTSTWNADFEVADPALPAAMAATKNTNAISALALALAAAGRPGDAITRADEVLAGDSGTYADTTVALEAKGLALAQQGDADGSVRAFQEARTIVEATDDVLIRALLRLAEGSALEVVGDRRASAVSAAADNDLEALGLSDTAWRVAFSVAASGVDLVTR